MNIHPQDNTPQPTSFGNLKPEIRSKVSIYCAETDKLLRDHYQGDLNSIMKKEFNDYFITKQPVKVVSCCGYVEYIGEKRYDT